MSAEGSLENIIRVLFADRALAKELCVFRWLP